MGAGRPGRLGVDATRHLSAIRGDAAGPVEPLDPSCPAPEVHACYAAYAPAVPGAVDRSPAFWRLHEHAGKQDGAFVYGVRTGAGSPATSRTLRLPTPVVGVHAPGRRLRGARPRVGGRAVALHRWPLDAGGAGHRAPHRPAGVLFLLDEQDSVTDLREPLDASHHRRPGRVRRPWISRRDRGRGRRPASRSAPTPDTRGPGRIGVADGRGGAPRRPTTAAGSRSTSAR